MYTARFDKAKYLPLMEAAGYLDEAELVRSFTDEEREKWDRAEESLDLLAWAADQREIWLERQYVRFKTGKSFPDAEDWIRELYPEEWEAECPGERGEE